MIRLLKYIQFLDIIKQNRTEIINKKISVDVVIIRQIYITRISSKHRNLIEELIYWLRKSADEMISFSLHT